MSFVRDCLDRKLTLRQVADKHGITLDEVMDMYHKERSKYTDEEIEEIIKSVYYL